LIARQLNSVGYRVLTASSGKEAKELILMYGSANIDLLITEMELPFMRGEELIQWFLQKEPGAQVIMMSSYPHAVNFREGITFLKKPFCLDALEAKISESLAKAEF
jgi:DNA-binding NtrC family response regulator